MNITIIPIDLQSDNIEKGNDKNQLNILIVQLFYDFDVDGYFFKIVLIFPALCPQMENNNLYDDRRFFLFRNALNHELSMVGLLIVLIHINYDFLIDQKQRLHTKHSAADLQNMPKMVL